LGLQNDYDLEEERTQKEQVFNKINPIEGNAA
jgi:plasmid maintenance system antidote protein VapI